MYMLNLRDQNSYITYLVLLIKQSIFEFISKIKFISNNIKIVYNKL